MPNENKVSKIDIFLVVVYLAGSYVLIMISWGRYMMFAAILGLLIRCLKRNKFVIKFADKAYPLFCFNFTCFCFLSVLWAYNIDNALSRSISLFEIMLCSNVIYLVFIKKLDIESMMKVLLYSGYVESVAFLLKYGLSELVSHVNDGASLNGGFGNQNYFGFVMATNILATLFCVMFGRKRWYHFLALVSVLVLAVSQSRTALLGCVAGVLFLLYLKIKSQKGFAQKVLKIISIVFGCVIVFFILQKFQVFSTTMDRMIGLTKSVQTGYGDNSANVRMLMIKKGFKEFLRNPIWGV